MVVGSGCVANDAEADEGFLEEVAGLGYGCRLHVACKPLGEVVFDFAQLCLVGDELVACADESGMDFGGLLQVVELECFLDEARVAVEEGGHALYLSVFAAHAAPDVVVAYLTADDYVHDGEGGIDAAGYSCGYDALGREGLDEFGCADGCVHFPDAALEEYDVVAGDVAQGVGVDAGTDFCFVFHEAYELFILDVHGCEDSDFHILYNMCGRLLSEGIEFLQVVAAQVGPTVVGVLVGRDGQTCFFLIEQHFD